VKEEKEQLERSGKEKEEKEEEGREGRRRFRLRFRKMRSDFDLLFLSVRIDQPLELFNNFNPSSPFYRLPSLHL
jgi:hypothetical protein